MENITSRELFKSYPTTLSLPKDSPYYGKSLNVNKPKKYWYDSYLVANPGFIGKVAVKSPQGFEVLVNYGKSFVEYPYGFQQINGQVIVDRLIISREDAILFNAVKGDEGTAHQESNIPDYTDFPWDRELKTEESVIRPKPTSGYMIVGPADMPASNEDIMQILVKISTKLDALLLQK